MGTIELRKVTTLILVLLPLLNCYAFGFVSNFSIGMLAMPIIIFNVLILYLLRAIKIKNIWAIFYLVVTLFLTGIQLIFSDKLDISSSFYSAVKVAAWAFIITFAPLCLDNLNQFFRFTINIGLIVYVFLVIQLAMLFIFRMPLSNGIDLGFIKPFYEAYHYEIIPGMTGIRLSSLFMEPNQLGNYMVLCLAITSLTSALHVHPFRKFLLATVFTSGVLISTSSAALFSLLIVGAVYVFNKHGAKFIIIAAALLPAIYIILLESYFRWVSEGLSSGLGATLGAAVAKFFYWETNSRLGGSFDILNSLSFKEMFFGQGLGVESYYIRSMEFTYFNSMTRAILYSGIVGFLIYLVFLAKSLYLSRFFPFSVALILICGISGLFSGFWFSPDSILYYFAAFVFVFYSRGNEFLHSQSRASRTNSIVVRVAV